MNIQAHLNKNKPLKKYLIEEGINPNSVTSILEEAVSDKIASGTKIPSDERKVTVIFEGGTLILQSNKSWTYIRTVSRAYGDI